MSASTVITGSLAATNEMDHDKRAERILEDLHHAGFQINEPSSKVFSKQINQERARFVRAAMANPKCYGMETTEAMVDLAIEIADLSIEKLTK